MRKTVVIGTRGSKLALWQASYISSLLKEKAGVETEQKIIKTKGDKILDVALAKVGDKGLFVKEIENELLAGTIDIAVHSMKDLPTEIPQGLLIAASSPREDYRDALVSLKFDSLDELPQGAVVGTSSLRRRAQLLALRADLEAKDVRGNVDTRLRKMEDGEFDAILMAVAGLKRLGFTEHIKHKFSEDEMIPAVGQGAVAIECRQDDTDILDVLAQINDAQTLLQIKAERTLMNELQGGCQVPIGAIAVSYDNQLAMKGMVASLDGSKVLRAEAVGAIEQPEELGRDLANKLREAGAEEILEVIRGKNAPIAAEDY